MKTIFFIFFLLILSCSQNSENKEDINLCETTECGRGYECNETNGECVKIKDYCLNDSQCEEGKICDKIHNKCKIKTVSTLCYSHEDCESWEICNFDKKTCIPRENMCNDDHDCKNHPFLKCYPESHRCLDPKDCYYTGCNEWEKCNVTTKKCELIEGYRNSNEDCSERFPYTLCNLSSHECEIEVVTCTSYTQCKDWEYCDTQEKICKPIEGRCSSFYDCLNDENGKTECDTVEHLCKTPDEFNCKNTGCSEYWKICDENTGICILKENSCNNDDDCQNNEGIFICNQEHLCVRNDCTVFGCKWWRECNETTGECHPRPSMCDTDCEDYAPFTVCNHLVHACEKPEGYCTDSEQCRENYYCDLNDNLCKERN